MALSSKLTEQYKLFAHEYIIDLDPKAAARRAGFSKPRTEGPKVLLLPQVTKYVNQLLKERMDRLQYTADDVLRRLVEIDRLDVIDILNDDGTIMPVQEWPEVWRRTITAMDVVEMKSATEVLAFVKKVKLPDKLRVIELIGKHTNIQAWKDNVNIAGSLSGIDALHAKRLGA